MTTSRNQKEMNMSYVSPTGPTAHTMPHNVEAEQQVLGTIMMDNAAFHKVSDILTEDHFFDPLHRRIFSACAARIKNAHHVSPVILKTQFENDEGLRQIGGPAYLVRMAGAAISSHAVRDYAEALLDAFKRRVLLAAISEAQTAIGSGGDIAEIQAGIELAGAKIVAADTKAPTISMLAATTKAMKMTHDAFTGKSVGLSTGIKSFDDLTGGFFPEDLVIIGGAPSMGKTTLALALCEAFGRASVGAAFVSLEMGDYSLAQRLLSSVSGVPYRLLRRGAISPEQGDLLKEAAGKVGYWPIEIVQGHVRDIQAIFATARQIQRKMAERVPGGMRVVVVDYLQLVRAPGRDRFQQVGEVSMGLKNMAKQLGVPVIALAQVNARNIADREDKRPKLADIRESGQIEQDADLIMFTHRDHYFLERDGAPRGKNGQVSTEALVDHEAALSASKNQMDVILAKHRHDGIGSVKLGCDMATNRIWDLRDGNVDRAMGFF